MIYISSDISTLSNNLEEVNEDINIINTHVGNEIKRIDGEIQNKFTDTESELIQLYPLFAENILWLNNNGDTSKVYVLPDGYIYAYQCINNNQGKITKTITDGFLDNTRVSSSQLITKDADGFCSCSIDISNLTSEVVINLSGIDWVYLNSSGEIASMDGYAMHFHNNDGHDPVYAYTSYDNIFHDGLYMECNAETLEAKIIIDKSVIERYKTICVSGKGISNDAIVTITYESEDAYNYEWINTGREFGIATLEVVSSVEYMTDKFKKYILDTTGTVWAYYTKSQAAGVNYDLIWNELYCTYGIGDDDTTSYKAGYHITDMIEVDDAKYTVNINTEHSYTVSEWSFRAVYYNSNNIVIGSETISLNNSSYNLNITPGASRFRLRLYDDVSDLVVGLFELVKYKNINTTQWNDTGIIYNGSDTESLLNLEKRITENTNTIAELKENGLSSNNELKNYVITESESKIDEILEAQSARTFNMIIMTDLHNNGGQSDEQIIHAIQGAGYIADRIKIDAYASLGDHTDNFNSSNWSDGQADIESINNHTSKYLNSIKNKFRLIGNHDYKESRSVAIFRMISAYSDNVVWGDMIGCYFYKDFEDYKLRIICMNTSDEGYINISNSQYNWFINSLDLSNKSDANEWQILIMSHVPLDWSGFTIPVNILKAYLNGTSWTDGTISCDFTNKNQATIIATVHGHIHNLLTTKLYDSDEQQIELYRIAMPEVTELYHNHYSEPYKCDTSYAKTADSAEDTSFTILCIDLDNKKINAICYGAGVNRSINY